tara:strand:- start:174 stop:776 length:603 start_codon:yes stop_codon:yes gene_type:complete
MTWQFFYWGPLLFHTTILPGHLKKLRSICRKDPKLDHRKSLAGIIQHEYTIELRDYLEIMVPYLSDFNQAAKEWYSFKKGADIVVTSAWVNYMKAGEFNPPHIHTGCDFSSVLFLDIPEELKKENKAYVGTASGPGCIQFLSGEPSKYSIHQKTFFPNEGDFFMFPGSLRHLVYPFKSDIERISIAANYTVKAEPEPAPK